jgi:hypothetical protein
VNDHDEATLVSSYPLAPEAAPLPLLPKQLSDAPLLQGQPNDAPLLPGQPSDAPQRDETPRRANIISWGILDRIIAALSINPKKKNKA